MNCELKLFLDNPPGQLRRSGRYAAVCAAVIGLLCCGDDATEDGDIEVADVAQDRLRRDVPPETGVAVDADDAGESDAVEVADAAVDADAAENVDAAQDDSSAPDVPAEDDVNDVNDVDAGESDPDDEPDSDASIEDTGPDIDETDLRPGTEACAGDYGVNTSDDYLDGSHVNNDEVRIAWRYDMPESAPIRRIEIVTGDLDEVSSRLGLWSNGEAGEPDSELAGGSFSIGSVDGWQGVTLDTPFVARAGQRYWIVWETVRGAQLNNQASGDVENVGYRTSTGGGAWNELRFAIWKFRMCR